MSKRLIIILALALVAGLNLAAYAEVQNVKVSGDLTMQGVTRSQLKLTQSDQHPTSGTPFADFDSEISGFLSQVRVRVDADLTDNVSTTVRLLNERLWGAEADASSTKADNSEIALDLAYVALKEFLYSPLSLTVGRQELSFGNGLIMGDVDTNGIAAGHGTVNRHLPNSLDDLSLRKAFDAVRATLNYDPLIVDAVYSKVDENTIDTNDDVTLYGVNANYALDKNTTVEGYYWEKRRDKAGPPGRSTSGAGIFETRSNDDIVRTLGSRVQYTGIENLLLGLEGAYQFGAKVNNAALYPNDLSSDGASRQRKAFALQAVSQYNLAKVKYTPTLKATYTFLSGEKKGSTDKKFRGWDSMFENQAGGTLFNKILGYSNAQLINAGVSLRPMEDLGLSVEYYNIRLVKGLNVNNSTLNAVNLSGVPGDPTYIMKPNKKSLANEVDATLTYDYTEDVQFGLTAGLFMPGNAFDKSNGDDAKQVIGSMKVSF